MESFFLPIFLNLIFLPFMHTIVAESILPHLTTDQIFACQLSDQKVHCGKNHLMKQVCRENSRPRINIAKMNVDENPATPGKFGIRSIPTLILFKNGETIDQVIGAVGKAQLTQLLDKAL